MREDVACPGLGSVYAYAGIHLEMRFEVLPLRNFDPARAALCGAVASAAYALEMYLDIAVSGSRFDDVQLVESALRGRTSRVPVIGMAIHLLNGAALGEIYAAVAEPLLPGPGWAKGLIFGELFLLAAWPTVPLIDRYHPLIKAGKMPRLTQRITFAQNVARHTVFGLVLGLLYRRR
ncbi:MAG: hypothetical protein ACXVDI_24960, partial [Ktedonobacterales bacterium]